MQAKSTCFKDLFPEKRFSGGLFSQPMKNCHSQPEIVSPSHSKIAYVAVSPKQTDRPASVIKTLITPFPAIYPASSFLEGQHCKLYLLWYFATDNVYFYDTRCLRNWLYSCLLGLQIRGIAETGK
jgi:hypothetical protein